MRLRRWVAGVTVGTPASSVSALPWDMDGPVPMPEPPALRQEDVAAIVRWLDDTAAWLREDMSVAARHGHPPQPQVEANLRLYEDAALLFREAYDGR
jgi:hypothetical protein